jgi:hypothetical protein
MILNAYPGHGRTWGYSAQTWIAKLVNEFLHPGSYFCWFATSFNAMRNGDDSNPIWIYLSLDRAVDQGGINNVKVDKVKANIIQAIDRELMAAGRKTEIAPAIVAVNSAALDMFTPQLWRIDISAIIGRYTTNNQYPDEHCVRDLRTHEFDVVIF